VFECNVGYSGERRAVFQRVVCYMICALIILAFYFVSAALVNPSLPGVSHLIHQPHPNFANFVLYEY